MRVVRLQDRLLLRANTHRQQIVHQRLLAGICEEGRDAVRDHRANFVNRQQLLMLHCLQGLEGAKASSKQAGGFLANVGNPQPVQ